MTASRRDKTMTAVHRAHDALKDLVELRANDLTDVGMRPKGIGHLVKALEVLRVTVGPGVERTTARKPSRSSLHHASKAATASQPTPEQIRVRAASDRKRRRRRERFEASAALAKAGTPRRKQTFRQVRDEIRRQRANRRLVAVMEAQDRARAHTEGWEPA